MKLCLKIGALWIAVLMASSVASAAESKAYYTKVDSGEEFEEYSRTGPYADIVVELGTGKFVFWRGASYLPYWQTEEGKWFVDEVIEREGDGPEERPDRVNTYSRVCLIESTGQRAVVWWRYLPKFGGTNPHTGVDATRFVDEYFIIKSNGEVKRTIREGTEKIEDWRDPLNKIEQHFKLTEEGIAEKKTDCPEKSEAKQEAKRTSVKKYKGCEPAAWWKFDEAAGDVTVESVSDTICPVKGHKSLWKKGVSGTSLMFDGYNSLIRLPASKAPKIESAITLEGWVAIGAYPWSWTPIVQQCDEVKEQLERMEGPIAVLTGEEGEEDMEEPSDDFTFVLKEENEVGYFLGIDGLGHPGLQLRVGDKWQTLVSDVHLERKHWYHIAGTYDKATGMMKIYVDGKEAGKKKVAKTDIETSDKDVKIGQGKPRRPIKPVRANTFMDRYSLDGLIDEVRIYDTALSEAQISQSYEALKPSHYVVGNPAVSARNLPEGKDTGEFGAYYTHLRFYETWDNLWRFSGHPDVVVELGDNPGKFVFWRGVGYIPMLVTEEGQWYTNEFNETWNKSGGQGCQEPMSDKESYTNHARIIENTDARVVVHWRYPLIDVLHVFANYNEDTGWCDWSDWYYYIYPDGAAVKTMHLWTHGERNHEWQEGIAVFGPDQHPEKVLETRPALILSDLDGNVDKHNWIEGPPDDVSYRNKKIHIVNYRADYDPFTVGNFEGGNIYGGELTDYAVFPTWNHWPVGQMPSDGRYASFPDRTGHSSLTHVFMPTYRERFGIRPFQEKLLMEGLSKKSAKQLIPLAKSWLNPAKLRMISGCQGGTYDRGQRAYILQATRPSMSFVLNANEDSPIVNPCFVISGWDEGAVEMMVNGREMRPGENLRIGRPRTVIDKDLVLWMEYQADEDARFVIKSSK